MSEGLKLSNRCPTVDQLGIRVNEGLGNTGYQNYYCNGQVLDSYRLESAFLAYNNIVFDNSGFRNDYGSGQVLESYRLDLYLPAINQSRMDFSKSMSQLLGSLGDLNLNVMEGFNIVAACSDNWRQAMRANQTGRGDRISKLEKNLAVMRSSLRKTQDEYAKMCSNQHKVSFMIDQHERTVSNLNLDVHG